MTRHQMVADLKSRFKTFEDPAGEARAVVKDALGIDMNELILHDEELSADQEKKIRSWADQRLDGMPLAYLSGKKGFHKYEFAVGPGVLVPRPETELLVFVGLKRVSRGPKIRVADLGCGSGCVGLTIAKELEHVDLAAVDISETACNYTRRNAQSLGLSDCVQVQRIDVVLWRPEAQFDLIVGNPPYIPQDDPSVEKGVHDFEPHEALYSGPDGLLAIRDWVTWAPGHLRQNGILALEIGAGQSPKVQEIMAQAGFQEIQIHKDFAGIDRIISGKRGATNG